MTNPARLPMAWRSLRNMLSRPATRLYPQAVRPPFEGARGMVELDLAACNFCAICVRRCPTGALEVNKKEKSVALEDLRCLACGICVEVCVRRGLALSTRAPQVFAAGAEAPGGLRVGRRTWRREVDNHSVAAVSPVSAP